MELIKIDNLNNFIPSNLVACIGEFDGLHKAHNVLIEKVIELSKAYDKKSCVITFDPHPDYVLSKSEKEEYITPLKEKIKLLENKIDYLIVINFNTEIANLSYLEFYNLFLNKIDYLVVGYDFRFGFKGLGNIDILKQLHKNVFVVDEVQLDGKKIGSKTIVNALKTGDIDLVNKLLGRYFKISGVVSKGSMIGRTIGYPTANVIFDDKYCLLKKGVYGVYINVFGKKHLGIANYGINPSFNKIDNPRLEVYIFDFDNDIYDLNVEVEIIGFIREEKKFDNIDEFLIQINKDCNYCISKWRN